MTQVGWAQVELGHLLSDITRNTEVEMFQVSLVAQPFFRASVLPVFPFYYPHHISNISSHSHTLLQQFWYHKELGYHIQWRRWTFTWVDQFFLGRRIFPSSPQESSPQVLIGPDWTMWFFLWQNLWENICSSFASSMVKRALPERKRNLK